MCSGEAAFCEDFLNRFCTCWGMVFLAFAKFLSAQLFRDGKELKMPMQPYSDFVEHMHYNTVFSCNYCIRFFFISHSWYWVIWKTNSWEMVWRTACFILLLVPEVGQVKHFLNARFSPMTTEGVYPLGLFYRCLRFGAVNPSADVSDWSLQTKDAFDLQLSDLHLFIYTVGKTLCLWIEGWLWDKIMNKLVL